MPADAGRRLRAVTDPRRLASIRAAVRSIPIDRSLATTRTSWWRASQREHCAAPAPISSTVMPVAHLEQVELGLGPALRPPDELAVAEEGAVLGVVVVGLAVPPGPVGRPGLVAVDRPPACVVDLRAVPAHGEVRRGAAPHGIRDVLPRVCAHE